MYGKCINYFTIEKIVVKAHYCIVVRHIYGGEFKNFVLRSHYTQISYWFSVSEKFAFLFHKKLLKKLTT